MLVEDREMSTISKVISNLSLCMEEFRLIKMLSLRVFFCEKILFLIHVDNKKQGFFYIKSYLF